MQVFRSVNFGIGSLFGAIFGTVILNYEMPKVGFALASVVAILITIAGFLTSDELETNQYADIKDIELERYEEEYRVVSESGEVTVPKPNCCVLLCLKLKAVLKGFSEPLLIRLFAMMAISGLFLPSFADFDLYFAVDKLKISMAVISL